MTENRDLHPINHLPKWTSLSTAYLLIFAAILKSIDPHYFIYGIRSVFGTSIYPSFSFVGIVISLELLLAIWMLSGVKQKNSLILATLTFISFSSFHIYANTLGTKQPCGCLGPFWNALGIKSHGWFDLSLAVVPAIFLIISLALIENNPDRIKFSSRLSLKKCSILILIFIGTLSLFSYKVENRDMYGIKALWGNFDTLNNEVSTRDNISQRLNFLMNIEKNKISHQEDLVTLITNIIHTQQSRQVSDYKILAERNLASLDFFTDSDGIKKQNNFQKRLDKAPAWESMAFDRITLQRVNVANFLNSEKEKIDSLNLDMGDSVAAMGVPLWSSAISYEKSSIEDKIQGDILAFTFPVILKNGERKLFYLIFSQMKNQWEFIFYIRIENNNPSKELVSLF